jgi:hypothetical protein
MQCKAQQPPANRPPACPKDHELAVLRAVVAFGGAVALSRLPAAIRAEPPFGPAPAGPAYQPPR